jgi:outer membrane protein TolC
MLKYSLILFIFLSSAKPFPQKPEKKTEKKTGKLKIEVKVKVDKKVKKTEVKTKVKSKKESKKIKFKTKDLSKSKTMKIVDSVFQSTEKVIKKSSKVLTLKKAIKIALKNNVDLRLAALKLEEARIEKNITKYKMYPLVKVESNAIFWNDKQEMNFSFPPELNDMLAVIAPGLEMDMPPILIRNQFTWQTTITIAQPITPLLTLKHIFKLKKAEVRAQKMNLKINSRGIIQQVEKAYFNCLKAESYLKAVIAGEKMILELEKKVKNLVKEKMAVSSELAKVLSSKSEIKAQKIKVVGSILLSRQYLAYLLGLKLNTPLLLVKPRKYKRKYENIKPAKCIKMAFRNRPEFNLLKIKGEQVFHAKNALKMDLLPKVSIVGQYQNSEGFGSLQPRNQWFIGAVLSWKFQWKNKYREIDKVELQKRVLELNLLKLKRGISLEIYKNHLGLKTQNALLEARKESVSAYLSSYKQNKMLYDQKYSTNSDLLKAGSKLTKARVELINTEYDKIFSLIVYRRSCGK